MRKIRVLRFKHLNFKNKKALSFRKLKNTPPFIYMDKDKTYFPRLFEGLVSFLQVWNSKSKLTEDIFKADLYDYIEEAEILSDIDVDPSIKTNVVNSIYIIYSGDRNKFNDFRGEIVEYLVVLLSKENKTKIYHEPEIKHKRDFLIQKQFLGRDCLIDVVNVHTRGHHIKLIECKADLDTQFKSLNQRKKHNQKEIPFRKKINNMNYLANLLKNYQNENNEHIYIEKVFAAIKSPKRDIPSICGDYKIVNLLHLLQDKSDQGTLDYDIPFSKKLNFEPCPQQRYF